MALRAGRAVELRKVIWPTRQETLQTTLMLSSVVIVFVLILGMFFWLLDMGLAFTKSPSRNRAGGVS